MRADTKGFIGSKQTALNIFLSYSAAEDNIAEQVYFTLTTSGHQVFFDRTNLPPGDEFDSAILSAIRQSDLFIFLISPDSIAEGRYTRTELRFAREMWPNPVGHVLPVLVKETDFSKIPNYLKAITILEPEGHIPAEVSATVNDLAQGLSPKETVAGQVETIKRTAQEVSQLNQLRTLDKIESQWEEEKEQYFIGETKILPSTQAAIGFGIGSFVFAFAIQFCLMSTDRSVGWWPFIVVLVIGGCVAYYVYVRKVEYEKAEKRYEEIRRITKSQK